LSSGRVSRPLVDFWVNGKLLKAAYRKQRFPQGCIKCRGRVGCTPSCWVPRIR
jgi:hypothetical protein